MLAGLYAVPLPDATARGGLPFAVRGGPGPRRTSVLPGELSLRRLSADLGATRWLRLVPYGLDGPALDTLAGAGGDRPGPVVVETRDPDQAQRVLHRLGEAGPVLLVQYREPPRHRNSRWGLPAGPVVSWQSRLRQLAGARVALHDSVLAAARRLPAAEFAAMVERSRTIDELTAQVAGAFLAGAGPAARSASGLAVALRHLHPRYASLAPAYELGGDLPWWTPLSDDWCRLDPGWQPGVLAACRSCPRPPVALLGRFAAELIEDGATDAAVELCLDTGFAGLAGDVLAAMGPDLVAAGRTLAVQRWLGRLPWTERRRHRTLLTRSRSVPHRTGAGASTRPVRADPVPGDPGPVPDHDLDARLLGTLSIRLAGRDVDRWHGRKGALLLAYLLLHRHERPAARDALAAVFWPDAPPAAARNRLHVTVHTLRADLQAASTVPVVDFDHGYRIHPGLGVVLDTEQFQFAAARAAAAEALGDTEAALRTARAAVTLYRGDLLAEHPFEEWLTLPREHFRVRALELLGRTTQLAFDTGRYAEALAAGGRLLALDFCREDVHRLLMRAQARLGRPQDAIRQFERCVGQLRRELGMAPAAETIDLYQRIRSRTPV
ncbi:bacterial transcriptional activator domain-containing protein [Actinoplanes sp. RD1]|uniref:bacterial transcriptional activator domain-containing protein n=1 Tax=Actinoplanes sp. RD1 TaxID=3064538 RepID=UPI002740610C|nr:bacterial transcriptional activator domain-containing protein [Actinoplanes sp. RD1]